MAKSGASKAIADVHKSGTHVPEKDFSSKKKQTAADSGGAKKGSLAKAKSLPTEKANSAPVASDPKPHQTKTYWEGSSEDWSSDYAGAKRKGQTVQQYEDSARDRLEDAAGERRMKADDSLKEDDSREVQHAPDYKQGVSAFSNRPKSSSGFGHPPSACHGALRCSGHSGAHQVGKKK